MASFAEVFAQAAQLCREDSRRDGNILKLDDAEDVVVAGDIHGNRQGLLKIINHADLPGHPRRRLILQEIIHGPLDPSSGKDRSGELLLRAARLKIAHPQQVLFILANHDIAQITGNEILKDGRPYCRGFTEGLAYSFGGQAADVVPAVEEFLLSQPLVVRCPNGVWISHSLPAPGHEEQAGTEILHRPTQREDLPRGKAAYEWVWGRGLTGEQLDKWGVQFQVDFFVLGHQHSEHGFKLISSRGCILLSEHEHGAILHFPTNELLSGQTAARFVRPIASLE